MLNKKDKIISVFLLILGLVLFSIIIYQKTHEFKQPKHFDYLIAGDIND